MTEKFYLETLQKENFTGKEIWDDPLRGFHNTFSGPMNYLSRKNLTGRIIIKKVVFPVRIIYVNEDAIKKWRLIRLKGKLEQEKFMKEFQKNLVYIFEVAIEEKIPLGGLIIKWENPTNGVFPTPKSIWEYILRNREKFSGYKKRLKTLTEEGEEVYIVSIDEVFINNMETNNFLERL